MKFLAVLKSYCWLGIAVWMGFSAHAFSQSRIVTTSPALTELIFQLGHGNQIVGSSQFSDYPEAAKAIPRIGTMFLPNLEKILKLSPNWVLVDLESTPKTLISQIEKLRVNCFRVSIQSVFDLFTESERIIRQIFNENQNDQLLKIANQFYATKQRREKHFSFVVLAWPNPMFFVGHHTFLSDLLTQLGGENLMSPNLPTPYPQVSEEWLIKHHPEILFIIGDNEEQKMETKRLSERLWPSHNTKVIFLSSEKFARTSFTAVELLPSVLEREL